MSELLSTTRGHADNRGVYWVSVIYDNKITTILQIVSAVPH